MGAQMKIAHKLRSAEHISKRELQRVLSGSLEASNFEVEQYQMEQMIEGIMKVCTIICKHTSVLQGQHRSKEHEHVSNEKELQMCNLFFILFFTFRLEIRMVLE